MSEKPEAQPEVKRNPRGLLGNSTPGRQLKNARPAHTPLKAFAREQAAIEGAPHQAAAIAWLESKGLQ